MNRKLALRLDALTVDSFSPLPAPAAARGTVHGNVYTERTCQNGGECWTWYHDTCAQTCGLLSTCHNENTCDWSCEGTCYEETACRPCIE